MRALFFCAALLTTGLPAAAQTPLTAEEFDNYTQGLTLSFSIDGTPYGVEQYLPDRRVRWTFVGDQCQDGVWFERDENICFLYENSSSGEQCWQFFMTDTGLRAVFQAPDGPTTEIYEAQQTDAPMACLGPSVGV